jgi:hypothetical protein
VAIHELLRQRVFDPETIAVMVSAYDGALHSLGVDRADPRTLEIAKAIIALAELGERDPLRLQAAALRELRKGK